MGQEGLIVTYSSIQMRGEIRRGRDQRWMDLRWHGWPLDEETNRYRLTVEPDFGWFLFVDEKDDRVVSIDPRNMAVMLKRSGRINEPKKKRKAG